MNNSGLVNIHDKRKVIVIVKFFRSTLGYMIAGVLVMSIWDTLVMDYGNFGGFFAAFIIIAPMWYMNHRVGLIENEAGHGFVDMALGIGLTGIVRDFFIKGGSAFISSLPTILLLSIGAVIGGLVAAMIEKDMETKNAIKASDDLKMKEQTEVENK